MSGAPKPSDLQLLTVRPGAVPEFKLLVAFGEDECIAPCLRDQGVWEEHETVLLQRILRPGMSVVDLGAHVGYFSVLMSKCVGPEGRVVAFEPDPSHFRLLCANLLANACDQAEARRLAIAEGKGDGRLFRSATNPGDQRLNPVPGRPSVAVRYDSLDSQLGQAGLDLVKMDCQGSESRILDGMAGLIERNRERLSLLMEFAPGLLHQGGCSIDRFAGQLGQLGACVFLVARQGRTVRLMEVEELASGLRSIAERMAQAGEEDASENLFVVFGSRARQAWLQRGSQGA
ncbi:FkbM family methyltransferase [Wenzhouxiangella sp. EGI_FJ10305]|uniref:FkbM family methyltransferase n=1 Tax=Wenzhouxiangella sp. EGI_FJ10305 TaxID=3243768 RepID=UPI0035DE977D